MERAWRAGLVAVVNPGADLASSRRACDLAAREERVWAAVGIHPHDATQWGEAGAEIRRLAQAPRVVAIGETGLDYYRMLSPAHVQQEALVGHIALARELGLPLILHCREAYPDMMEILRREKAGEVGGVLHCFSGDEEAARRALDMGLYLGFAGPVTFASAHSLRRVLRLVPLERILVETDCPYLTPEPWRGKRNEPAFVTRVAEAVALAKGVARDRVASVTTENARRLFRLP
jgi:TatD DNase family protein